MPYRMRNDAKARQAGRFIYSVQKELQNAFVASGVSEQEIAEKLGVDCTVVSMLLLGEANLTLRMIADLAWAMDAEVILSIKPRHPEQYHRGVDMPMVDSALANGVNLSAASAETLLKAAD